MRRGIAAMLAGLALLAAGAADRAEAASGDLERLREAIAESRSRLAYYEREERGILDALDAVEHSAALLAGEVARARARAAKTRSALAQTEAEAEGVAERLAALETAMSRRAVALYRVGELGAVPLLFAAGDLRDFLSRVQILRRLLSHDASLLASHRATKRSLEEARKRAALAAEESTQAEQTLEERSSQLVDERARKRQLARRLRSSRARERRALAELESAARALEEAVAAMPDEGLTSPGGAPSAPFVSLRGALPAPVSGSVSRGFGRVVDSEFRTATFRKGVEFDVVSGTSVQAVGEGRVRYAGRFRGYGNTVIVDHGDRYFTVSAHLAEIAVAVGDWVEPGLEIGRSGESGSLTGPHLYFEVRRGADALDPRDWLE